MDWFIEAYPELTICDSTREAVTQEQFDKGILVPLAWPQPEHYDYRNEEFPTFPSSMEIRSSRKDQQGFIVEANLNKAIEHGAQTFFGCFGTKLLKDSDGRVTALSSNMAEFNRLQTAVADDVLARLSQVSASELAVPLGTLTGSPLLAGRGPKLTVKMETIGTATAKFRDKFTAAGINQTKHQILLDVDVRVSILLPGITTYTKVSNEISVAETVIVGGVPQTYTYFSTTEDKIEDYADEYIMNNG